MRSPISFGISKALSQPLEAAPAEAVPNDLQWKKSSKDTLITQKAL